VAAAEAAFNALLAQIAAEAEARAKEEAAHSGNGGGNGHAQEEDVATAMARLLAAEGTEEARAALPPPLLRWSVHRFEGWVGGVLGGINASEVRVCGEDVVGRFRWGVGWSDL